MGMASQSDDTTPPEDLLPTSMTSTALVSVILPCFNAGRFLKEADVDAAPAELDMALRLHSISTRGQIQPAPFPG